MNVQYEGIGRGGCELRPLQLLPSSPREDSKSVRGLISPEPSRR